MAKKLPRNLFRTPGEIQAKKELKSIPRGAIRKEQENVGEK